MIDLIMAIDTKGNPARDLMRLPLLGTCRPGTKFCDVCKPSTGAESVAVKARPGFKLTGFVTLRTRFASPGAPGRLCNQPKVTPLLKIKPFLRHSSEPR